jgi:hypothetical protein
VATVAGSGRLAGAELGAPCVDCERPYRNSSVERDSQRILTGELERELPQEQPERCAVLRRKTPPALETALVTHSFVSAQYEADMHKPD